MIARRWAWGLLGTCCLVVGVAVVMAQDKKPSEPPKKADPPKKVEPGDKSGLKPARMGDKAGKPTSAPSGDAMAEMMKKWAEYATPGEHHKHLDAMTGKWDYTLACRMDPEAPMEESKGTSEFKWIFDGRYLQQEASCPGEGPERPPFKGLGLYGYDNAKKQYVNVWLDNMGTGIMIGYGDCDTEGKVINFAGEYACPMTGDMHRKFRLVIRFEDKDKFVYEMYSPGPDGKEFKMMEITSTRAK